jgi:hypothetical protein
MQFAPSDYIQLGGAVFNGLTMLATATSVFFAIHVYRRNRSKEEFSAFRLSLLNLRHGVSELDSLLSEPPFTQLGFTLRSTSAEYSLQSKMRNTLSIF